MGWVGPQATSHIYFFIDTIFIMGYCRNRAVIGDIAVIGKCKASLMGPPNAGRRDPESNCIVKMSGGDVTRNSQGYGFFLFFLGRVGPKPTSTYNRHANRELFFLGGWARRSQAGCDNMSRDTMTHWHYMRCAVMSHWQRFAGEGSRTGARG